MRLSWVRNIHDVFVFGIVTLVALTSFVYSGMVFSKDSFVLIESKGVLVYNGNLSENRKITIRGPHGDVRIQIRSGMVAVVFSRCPDKLCVGSGWQSRIGQSIVCSPNGIEIRIVGERPETQRKE
jgi:hypothetical protein